jgi:hypothetical protein
MPQRACDHCGTEYLAKRSASKFCSDRCRKRASRAPAPVVPLKPPRKSRVKKSEPDATPEESTTSVVRAVLTEHGRLLTPQGMAALRIAERLDSPAETGAAIATLSTKLGEALDRALDGVHLAADSVDELRARRAKRASG